jgi:hypothetical protein
MLLVGVTLARAADFCEIGGLVVMEAESASSVTNWVRVSGRCGYAMEDHGTRQGALVFSVTFSQTGDYYVWLLCANGPNGTESNDCFIYLDGERSYDPTGLRPDGIRRTSTRWGWTSQPKGPGAHTTAVPPIHVKVLTIGEHVFRVGSRSDLFRVDKIALCLNGLTEPGVNGCEPSQTVCGGTGVQLAPVQSAATNASGPAMVFGVDGRMIASSHQGSLVGLTGAAGRQICIVVSRGHAGTQRTLVHVEGR